MNRRLNSQSGFTLIELMVVVNILGILSVIAMHAGLTYMERARERITKESLRVLRQAITMYNLDTGHYPPHLVIGDYADQSPDGRGGGNTLHPDGYKYIKRLPSNQMPGEDDNYPANWVTEFEDATDTQYLLAFSQRWDGWFYFYKINGEEAGIVVVPRSGTDLEGNSYSEW